MKFKNLPKKIEKCKVAITFFPETLRSADLSNKTESIMDLLVDCGIIKDDNWFVCSELTLKLGQVDKQNPRAEVTITY